MSNEEIRRKIVSEIDLIETRILDGKIKNPDEVLEAFATMQGIEPELKILMKSGIEILKASLLISRSGDIDREVRFLQAFAGLVMSIIVATYKENPARLQAVSGFFFKFMQNSLGQS